MSNYLSFKNFSTNEYFDFIESCPRKLLLVPLKNLPKYKTSPLIKGFRDNSIKIETIRNFYYKEAKKNNQALSNEILRLIDKIFIQKILTSEQYAIVSKQNMVDKDVYNKTIKELCESEKNVLKVEYIIKLLDLDTDIANEVNRVNFEKKEKEVENKRDKEITSLKEKNERLLVDIEKQKEDIKILKETLKLKKYEIEKLNDSLNQIVNVNSDTKDSHDIKNICIIDILNKIEITIKDYSYSEIFDEFKRVDIRNYSIENVYSKINKVKKEAIRKDNIHLYNKLTFIELMILNILEEINNEG